MLIARKLKVEFGDDLPSCIVKDNPFLSAFLITMSFYLPVGEKYIMSSLGGAIKHLDKDKDSELIKEIKVFLHQESFHKDLHDSMNAVFERKTKNKIGEWVNTNIEKHKAAHIRGKVGLTMASEHTTCLLANWLINNRYKLKDLDERIYKLIIWHCAEEIEHRATAFKVYTALGGEVAGRKKYLKKITMSSICYALIQTIINLYYDGSLLKLKTWKGFYDVVLSKNGLLRSNYQDWKALLSPEFNPDNFDETNATQWLADNYQSYEIKSAT